MKKFKSKDGPLVSGLIAGCPTLEKGLRLPFALGNDAQLDVATKHEANHLRGILDRFSYMPNEWVGSPSEMLFDLRPIIDGDSISFVQREAPDIRIFVVRCRGGEISPQKRLNALSLAGELQDQVLRVPAWISDGPVLEKSGVSMSVEGGGAGLTEEAVWSLAAEASEATLSESRLTGVADLATHLLALDSNRDARLMRSSQIYSSAVRDGAGNLYELALFIALEALLCRKPVNADRNDSITRQLKRAVPLMLRRGGRLDDFSIGKRPIDKTISDLYEFRSEIAHGAGAAVPKKLEGEFKTVAELAEFLRRMVAAVIAQSAVEPELASDVRGPD